MKINILMAESSDIYHDGRVLKEANTLSSAGYKLVILGFRQLGYKSSGNLRNYNIWTLPIISRKYRVFRNITVVFNLLILNLLILFKKADVYHAHNTMFLIGMYLSKEIHRGKFIYDCHEVQSEHGIIDSILEVAFIHKTNAIINVCEGRSRIQSDKFKLNPNNITVLHNYPNRSSYIPDFSSGLGKKLKFIFCGGYNLNDNKLDNFIRTLAMFPDVEFHILGFGYKDSEINLKMFVEASKLTDRVIFHPLVPPSQVVETISKYDVAVNFLYNPKNLIAYNFPAINKMYEFLSAGLPILTTYLPAFITEYVDQGVAISVNPLDLESISKGINYFYKDRDKIVEMKKKAYSLSQTLYNWEKQEFKLLNLYKDILSGNDLSSS